VQVQLPNDYFGCEVVSSAAGGIAGWATALDLGEVMPFSHVSLQGDVASPEE